VVLTDVRWCGDGRGPAAEYTTAHMPGAVRGGPGAVAVRRRRRRGGIRCRLEGGRRGHAAGLRGRSGHRTVAADGEVPIPTSSTSPVRKACHGC